MAEQKARYLTVIGATATPTPEELPQFLDPICVDLDQNEYFVAHVAPWDESTPPQLYEVSQNRFEEECEAGYWQLLPQTYRFRWGYRLLALKERELAYLPAEEAYACVREQGMKALQEAEIILAGAGPPEDATKLIWYATRAIPQDPFPLLAGIALDRERLSSEFLSDLTSELPEPTKHSPASTLITRARIDNWSALLGLIARDPLGSQYLQPSQRRGDHSRSRFLNSLPDDPEFFAHFQRCYGSVTAKAA